MYQVKLCAAPLQPKKKIEKEIGLGKEALVDAAFLQWLREVGRQDSIWNVYRLNRDTRNERVIPGEKRHRMTALY